MKAKSCILFMGIALSSLVPRLTRAESSPDSDYRLTRQELELRLDSMPIAPVRCTAEALDPLDGRRISAEVSWSPASNDPLVQHVRFPKEVIELRVHCGGDLKLQGTDASTASWVGYASTDSSELTPPAEGTSSETFVPLSAKASLPLPSGAKKENSFDLKVHLSLALRSFAAADLRTSTGTAVARARSLDPITPLLNDVLTAAAGVAVDRADAAAMQLIKGRLLELLGPLKLDRTKRVIQALRFEDVASSGHELERALIVDARTYLISRLARGATIDPVVTEFLDRFSPTIEGYLDGTSVPTERDFQLLIYEVARLRGKPGSWQWLASMTAAVAAECSSEGTCSADQLSRGLEREAIKATIDAAKSTDIFPTVITPVTSSLLEVDADAQKVFKALCKDQPSCPAQESWNRARLEVEGYLRTDGKISAAISSVVNVAAQPGNLLEATRNLVDTVETFQKALLGAISSLPEDVKEQASLARLRAASSDAVAAFAVLRGWPELSSIAARLVEVLQPPPGATPRQTATVATQLTFDILDHAVRGNGVEVQRAMEAARAITVATINGDTRAALGVALTEIAYVGADAKGSGYRASEVLGAVVQYASTYTHDDSKDPKAAATAADERKKALDRLVTSLTDRSQRKDYDNVFSFGAGVGIGFVHGAYRKNSPDMNSSASGQATTDQAASTNYVALALPLGFAWDVLPGDVGFHGQIDVLDIAQYVNVSSEGHVAKATLGTAVNLGLTAGVTLFSKTTPVLVGVNAGWAPGLQIDPNASHAGQFTVSALLGTYVPFVDFN